MESFIQYCLKFYGKGGLYEKDFDKPFTTAEIKNATKLLIASGHDFAGDTFDREKVCVLIMMARGAK